MLFFEITECLTAFTVTLILLILYTQIDPLQHLF